jgi:hypothetical protein
MNQLVTYDAKWAEMAQRSASEEQLTGGTFLSIKGGVLKFGDELLPGNQACVIILDSVFENTYYGARYTEGNRLPPICYAFGRGGDEMAPHTSMQSDLSYFKPQSADCANCAHNEWGSNDTGRGKACQNRRRLALLPAGYYSPKRGSRDFDLEIFDDPAHFKSADIAFFKVPVTSTKDWAKYVNQVAQQMQRPPMGVITRLSVEPHDKHQVSVHFEPLEPLPDALAPIIMARAVEAEKALMQGYRPPSEEQLATGGEGQLRGLGARGGRR